jgi:hypothetical protein
MAVVHNCVNWSAELPSREHRPSAEWCDQARAAQSHCLSGLKQDLYPLGFPRGIRRHGTVFQERAFHFAALAMQRQSDLAAQMGFDGRRAGAPWGAFVRHRNARHEIHD